MQLKILAWQFSVAYTVDRQIYVFWQKHALLRIILANVGRHHITLTPFIFLKMFLSATLRKAWKFASN